MNSITPAAPPAQVHSIRHFRDAREEIDVLAVGQRLWRRKFLILCLTALLTVPPAAVILNLTPRYRAEAQVMVEDRKLQIVSMPDVLSAHSPAEDTVLSEVQVITSRDLAKAVVQKLGLKSDPEFNSSLRPLSRVQELERQIAHSLHGLPFLPARRASAENDEAAAETRIVNAFLDKLTVAPLGRSRVIRIVFESESPTTAALAANTIAELYQENQIRAKANAAKGATQWLESHLAELQEKAEGSRVAREQYRREAGLLQGGKDSTLVTQQAGEINRQLVAARTRESEAAARLAYARAAIASHGNEATLSEIVQSPLIQALRQQEASLRQRIADLQTTFGPKYPRVEQAEAELEGLHQAIAREANRITQSLAADVSREKANVNRMIAMLDGTKDAVGKGNEAEAKMATLDRELMSNEAVYLLFLDRVKQTNLQQGSQQPDSQVVSRADPPERPFFPRSGILLSLALVTSGLASTFTALALDRRNSTLVGLDQVQAALGSGSLGFVPLVKGFRREWDALQLFSDKGSLPTFSEAIRNLHARLLLASARPKVVMFASALPGEGKSVSSIALALLIAHSGRRAIIVDCDVRRPHVHRAFGLSRASGLTDYLRGTPFESVVRTVDDLSLDVITAGEPVNHPAPLLASDRMKELLCRLTDEYDLVVIDSSPVLVVSDALVLAPLVDKIVFLVQWARTPQAAAEHAIELLQEAGANIAGTMLSMVNMAKMKAHDLGAGYYRKVQRYYRAT